MLFWYGVLNYIKSATTFLVIAGAFAGIILVVCFSIKIGRKHPSLAILFSTIISCVLTVPLVTSFNNLVDRKITGTILDEGMTAINAQKAEVERLKAETRARTLEQERLENEITIAKQSIEIEALNTRNALLERAQLSMQTFRQIAELALTQADFTQTLVRKEPLSPLERGWNILAEYYNDEALVIINHDISAKFGVDLKEVRIIEIAADHIVVSGIRPKFIGADKNEREIVLSEIRRNNYKRGVLAGVERHNDKINILRAENKAEQYEMEFQRKLGEGIELTFMNDVIVQLAENFIKIVFAPLYTTIEFDNAERPEALPLMDYLAEELKTNNEEKLKLLQLNEQVILHIEQMEAEVSAPETGTAVTEIPESVPENNPPQTGESADKPASESAASSVSAGEI